MTATATVLSDAARRRDRGGDRRLRRPPAAEPRLPGPRPTGWPAAPRPTGRSPSRRRCGSATARGSKIYDVDGVEYSDFHGGYGVSLAGHAHPAIVAAVQDRVTRGTHFAQPTEDAIVVADNLAERFDQPLWRFANSGTEATMDAVHLMRAATGRDRILKVEGCYHGHHDSVEVSVLPEADDDIGPADRPHNVPDNTGIPERDHGPGRRSSRSTTSPPSSGRWSSTPARSPA